MMYLLLQLFIYLLCALALGIGIGYLIWGWWGRTTSSDAEVQHEALLHQQQQKCDAEKAELQTIIDNQAKALEEAQAVLAKAPETNTEKSETFVTDAPKPSSLYTARPDEVDDLKRIRGIGPVMERILNDNGCYQFKQLAEFSERDVEWISAAINTFPDRIARDRWVEQAQELYAAKSGPQ